MGTRSDARSRFGWPARAGSARYGSASQVVPFHDRDQRKVASTERSCSVSQSSVSDSSCSRLREMARPAVQSSPLEDCSKASTRKRSVSTSHAMRFLAFSFTTGCCSLCTSASKTRSQFSRRSRKSVSRTWRIGKPSIHAFHALAAEAGQRFREQAGRERQYAFEPFKLAFRGAVVVRTVIKAGVHGPENSLGERIGRQLFNAFEHGGFGASVGEAEERLCSRKPFIGGLAGGQFVQYGGAFFAEFRLVGSDQGQREAQPARGPGGAPCACRWPCGSVFGASRSAGTASPPSRKAMMP